MQAIAKPATLRPIVTAAERREVRRRAAVRVSYRHVVRIHKAARSKRAR